MKNVIKSTSIIALALIMILSSLIIVAAEQIATPSDEGVTISSVGGGTVSPQAYELVWKYKSEYGHLWRRRWNATLGGWYDPAWILVY